MTSPYSQKFGRLNILPHDFENRLSSALKPESKGMRIRHDISDLSTLEVLDTSTVLNSLKSRFQEGLYYVSNNVVSFEIIEMLKLIIRTFA